MKSNKLFTYSGNESSFRGKVILIFVFVLGLGINQLHSQEYLDLIYNPTENTTLQEIQSLAEAYFADRDKGRGSGYKQYKRWEYKMERFVNADGKLQNFGKLTWDVTNEIYSENSNVRSIAGDWFELGPSSYTNGTSGYNGGLGRVNVIAFHPTDPDIIYVGVPAGGVWKTTDGGSSWTPLADILSSIGVSGIAVDHTTPSTIYILTGDGDGAQTYSIGVMKSTDSGATWTSTALAWSVTAFERGFKLLMHPTDSSTMFAATTDGLLKTTDGWASYSTVVSGSFRDIEFKPGTPTTVYAAKKTSFYRSTNTGSTWTLISSGLPTSESRSAIAVTPAASGYVYYLAGPGGSGGSGTYKGMYLSTDSGLTFSTMSTTPNILGYDSAGGGTSDQSSYDLALAVNPTDEDVTISGGINVWRSTNGGVSNTLSAHWYSPTASQYVHADIHDLVYNPVDDVLYCGSDGGISKSTDDGLTWTNIWDGLSIMQFYRIAGVDSNQDLLIGGTQDNGSNKYTGSTTIEHILGGDGMDCMIDYTDNDILYYGFQLGGLQRSVNGGDTSTGIKPAGASGTWVTPYAMDATDPTIIYGGYTDVYRSTDMGDSWSNLGSDGSGALAVGVDDPSRIYAAAGSTLTTSSNTGATWSTISGPWPALTITFIAIDPDDADRVWITLGGFTAGEKVYESTDAGGSWTNVSGSLPNSPALSIAYQDTDGSPMDAIYVGMSVAVFYKSDVTPWTLFNTDLPNAPIYDLEINYDNCKLRAGTFGRGIWETYLYGTAVIVDVVPTETTCPTSSDGTLTITASCATCTGISYTITPTAPPGSPITQIDDGVFTGLAVNEYDVTVVDTGSTSCTNSWDFNPVPVGPGPDTTDPTAVCADITIPLDASGAATITPGDIDAGSTDNCGIDVISVSPDSFDCSDLGTPVLVTLTVEDEAGNIDTCTAFVTVEDVDDPTAMCTDITIDLDSAGMATITAGDVELGSTDNCGIDSMTVSPSSFACSDIGTPVTVTLTVSDASGNMDTCTAVVTVEDNLDPDLTCPADQTHMVASGTLYEVPDYFMLGEAVATDNCTDPVTITSQVPAVGTMLGVGVHVVTITAEDAYGNVSTCDFDLTVEELLGISDFNLESNIVLHPNPVSNELIITNNSNRLLSNALMYDISGKLVSRIDLQNLNHEHTINVSSYSAGVYIIKITAAEDFVVKQIVIE